MLLLAKPFPIPFLILVHSTHIYLPMQMEQTECSKTSAYKLQTPGNYPKESIQQNKFCMETQQCILCVFLSYMSLSTIKKLNVSQQCSYGTFRLTATKKICRPSCTVPDAALKHKNVHLPVAFFRHAIWLSRS